MLQEKVRDPRVSVVIPVYNCEPFLPKCIESVQAQIFGDFELILVDDHSKDNSIEVCRKYEAQDPRISVYLNPSKGVSEARNHGLDKARGRYVCFIDADDWVSEKYISDFFIHEFKGNNTLVMQNLDCSFKSNHNHTYLFHEDRIITDNFAEEIVKADLFQNRGACAKLFDMRLLNEKSIRFPLGLSLNEDQLFFLEYIQYVDEIILLAKYNYYYERRIGEDTLSQTIFTSSSKNAATRGVLVLKSIRKSVEHFNIRDENYLQMMYNRDGLFQMEYAFRHITPKDFKQVAELFVVSKPFFKYYRSKSNSRKRMIERLLKMPESRLTLYFNVLYLKNLYRKLKKKSK